MSDPTTLVATRRALHAVAEQVLAGDLWRRTGRIGLRRTPGGFGQPELLGADGRHRVRVDGTALVVLDGDIETWHDLTTLAAAAAAAGTTPGGPEGVYQPSTSFGPDDELAIDPTAAAALAAWFVLVESALDEVRRRHRADGPTIAQLWPEHFDLAISLAEVNVGGSPGDDAIPEPYLYVGPWTPRPGEFWDQPWGASRPASTVADVAAAVEFFEAGLVEAARS
jgi:hypothetical protein